MFDWIVPGYRVITWRPVYEAFFQEYAWECDRTGKSGIGNWIGVSGVKRDDFDKFKLKALKDIQRKKREAEGEEIGGSHYPFQIVRILSKPFGVAWDALSGTPNTPGSISPCLEFGKKIDHHLLYYHWSFPKPDGLRHHELRRSQSLESGDSESIERSVVRFSRRNYSPAMVTAAPLLIRSIKKHGVIKPSAGDAGCKWHKNAATKLLPWSHRQKPLWIYRDHPCIEVFDRELLSLSLILGLRLEGSHRAFTPQGLGSFGSVLMSEKRSMFSVLSIAINRNHRSDKAPAGSGYSSLFAIYMACGFLPFSQMGFPGVGEDDCNDHIRGQSAVETHCVVVTGSTRQRILAGALLDNSNANGWRLERNMAADLSLPNNILDMTWPRANPIIDSSWLGKTQSGDIYHLETQSETFQESNRVGSWCEAVAGIAFGGLVPMVTVDLREAVKDTVGGAMATEEEVRNLHILMNSIENHAGRRLPSRDIIPLIEIFGSAHERIACYLPKGGRQHNTDFFLSFQSELKPATTEQTVEHLARLSTILEYLIAASKLDTEVIVRVDPNLSNEEKKVEMAFRKCTEEVQVSYQKAIQSQQAWGAGAPPVPSAAAPIAPALSEIEVVLSDITRKLDEDDDILASDCGKIAKCIIMAWVKLVTLISWSDRGTGVVDGDGVYHPPLLEELPYISAWE
ncbi:hypothetical protein B0T14DRAFT_600625 [Immersiella caudata]|uniref:Uncharacterized protein n=1 Tax=Immersiella caudata TaxID=314043 RepID=A0AA39X4Y4_9PEZI|nr:hypothetical protein B0T14DRAFT_600625 [Immersiella caudata]